MRVADVVVELPRVLRSPILRSTVLERRAVQHAVPALRVAINVDASLVRDTAKGCVVRAR